MGQNIKGDHFKLVKDIHQDMEDFTPIENQQMNGITPGSEIEFKYYWLEGFVQIFVRGELYRFSPNRALKTEKVPSQGILSKMPAWVR